MRTIEIKHKTEYHYDKPVYLHQHQVHLRPREGHDLHIVDSTLTISPTATVKWYRDIDDNTPALLNFPAYPTNTLCVKSTVELHHYETAPLDFVIDDYAVTYPFHYDPTIRIELHPYLTHAFPSSQQALREWVREFWKPGAVIDTYGILNQMNNALANDFTYSMREAQGVQTPEQTLLLQSGSCRDLATLFIEACRFIGLASRFVSGYLVNLNHPDHDSTHAWSEVYLPGAGWKGFDNTSGIIVGTDHIATAVSRHPERVPPISGTFTGPPDTQNTMNIEVDVTAKEV